MIEDDLGKSVGLDEDDVEIGGRRDLRRGGGQQLAFLDQLEADGVGTAPHLHPHGSEPGARVAFLFDERSGRVLAAASAIPESVVGEDGEVESGAPRGRIDDRRVHRAPHPGLRGTSTSPRSAWAASWPGPRGRASLRPRGVVPLLAAVPGYLCSCSSERGSRTRRPSGWLDPRCGLCGRLPLAWAWSEAAKVKRRGVPRAGALETVDAHSASRAGSSPPTRTLGLDARGGFREAAIEDTARRATKPSARKSTSRPSARARRAGRPLVRRGRRAAGCRLAHRGARARSGPRASDRSSLQLQGLAGRPRRSLARTQQRPAA